jgi:hypothetical protein
MMSGDKRGKIRSNGEKRERGKFHISVGYHADQEDFGVVKRFRIHPRICPEVVVLTNVEAVCVVIKSLRNQSPIFWTKKSTFSLKLVQVRKTQHDSLNHETSDST